HREQQVAGGEVLVVELLALLVGRLQHAERAGRQTRVANGRAADLRQLRELVVDTVPHRVEVDADALEHAGDDALGLVEEGAQQVFRRDLGVAGVAAGRLRGADCLLRLARELVGVERHGYFPFLTCSRARTTDDERSGTSSRRYCWCAASTRSSISCVNASTCASSRAARSRADSSPSSNARMRWTPSSEMPSLVSSWMRRSSAMSRSEYRRLRPLVRAGASRPLRS